MTEYITEISTMRNHEDEIGQAIALRAYAQFEADGSTHGRDLDHWLEAEARIHEIAVPYEFEPEPDALTLRIVLDPGAIKRLAISIAEKSILLYGLDSPDTSGGRSLVQVISLPATIIPDATEAALDDNQLVLVLRPAEVPIDA